MSVSKFFFKNSLNVRNKPLQSKKVSVNKSKFQKSVLKLKMSSYECVKPFFKYSI